MNTFSFSVTKDVLNLGVKIYTARISAVTVSPNDDLEQFVSATLNEIKESWKDRDLRDGPVLQGFRQLHLMVGRGKDYFASPEALLRSYLTLGRFPRINPLVDLYNLISMKSGLALGAHDIEFIRGGVTLRLTRGLEKFVPLGKTENVSVPPGEYAYIDDENNIICRLEVVQCELTKINSSTRNVFLIVQGNEKTSESYVRSAASETCTLITQLFGGRSEILNPHD